MCEALVDDREAIIVFIDPSKEVSVHLPAKFEGFLVFISYEAFQLHHRSFHKELSPGISIDDAKEPQSASTLGALFRNSAEPDKTFILTIKHGVGKKNDVVVQPGTLDKVCFK